jgi:hypothetical protein
LVLPIHNLDKDARKNLFGGPSQVFAHAGFGSTIKNSRATLYYVDGGNAVSSKKELVSQLVIHPINVLCGVEKSTLSESIFALPRLFPNLD